MPGLDDLLTNAVGRIFGPPVKAGEKSPRPKPPRTPIQKGRTRAVSSPGALESAQRAEAPPMQPSMASAPLLPPATAGVTARTGGGRDTGAGEWVERATSVSGVGAPVTVAADVQFTAAPALRDRPAASGPEELDLAAIPAIPFGSDPVVVPDGASVPVDRVEPSERSVEEQAKLPAPLRPPLTLPLQLDLSVPSIPSPTRE